MDRQRKEYLRDKVKEVDKIHEHFINKHQTKDTAALLTLALYMAEVADAIYWQLGVKKGDR